MATISSKIVEKRELIAMPDTPPLPPEILANALTEPIHKEVGRSRPVRAVRAKKRSDRAAAEDSHSTVGSLLEYAETSPGWVGDDCDECLGEINRNRC